MKRLEASTRWNVDIEKFAGNRWVTVASYSLLWRSEGEPLFRSGRVNTDDIIYIICCCFSILFYCALCYSRYTTLYWCSVITILIYQLCTDKYFIYKYSYVPTQYAQCAYFLDNTERMLVIITAMEQLPSYCLFFIAYNLSLQLSLPSEKVKNKSTWLLAINHSSMILKILMYQLIANDIFNTCTIHQCKVSITLIIPTRLPIDIIIYKTPISITKREVRRDLRLSHNWCSHS